METDIHSIEVFLKLLRESQLRIDTLLEKIDAQQLTDCPKVKSKIQGELAEQFAKQISTKRTLLMSEEFKKCDITSQRKFAQYPNFRQWLKSIELRHLLNVSLESNIESLESLFSTPWDKVKVIAQTCGATDAEISTLYNGLRVLRAHLDGPGESSLHETSTANFERIFKSPSQSSNSELCPTVRRCSSLENPDDLAYKMYGRPRPHRKKMFEKQGEISDDGYGTQTSVDRFLPVSTASTPSIQHNFVTKKFNITSIGHCGVCSKFLVSGLRCADCRYKCHKKCAPRVTERCKPTSIFTGSVFSNSHLTIDAEFVSRSQTLSDKDLKGQALTSKKRGGLNSGKSIITSGSSTWHPPHSKSIPLVSDITGNTGGSAVFSHGSREGPIGSTSSNGSNSRIFGGGVGTGVAALNDSSTGGSCSSSFLALSTNELPSMTAAPVNSRQRGRFSSSTTAASSDVSSSVESSPSHFKCPTATGAPRHQIFTFTGCIPDREMSSGLDGSGGAQGEYLAVPVPNSAPYIGHASTAPVPGVYSTCSSLGGLKFKRNNAEQDAATTTSVVEATSMAQLHGVSRSSHDGIGTNESSVLDSDGVTISRESGENTSTTLTDSENAPGSTTQKEKMSVGEFERRMDDDYDEIQSLHDVRFEKLLGRGKFATVYRGYWHGEVAVKLYHNTIHQSSQPFCAHCVNPLCSKSNTSSAIDSIFVTPSKKPSRDCNCVITSCASAACWSNCEDAVKAARRASTSLHDTDIIMKDIKTLCKARHNNIVLFMAACRNPPAIITSLCKGKTLYKKIHLIREEMSMLTILHILEQVAQGMGYLHGRLIIHKDLRSKNIFVDERQHVTITDYGLANITKVVRSSPSGDISIYCPVGWLSYLAPELIKALRPSRNVDQTMPFSMETDVYAFGSVCYELMSGRFLYQNLHCQTIIWIIASGCRKSLDAFQSSRIMKDFLLKIWNFNPDNRPLFSQIHSDLREVERKICSEKPSLDRYPSQPITVSRSMERINVAF